MTGHGLDTLPVGWRCYAITTKNRPERREHLEHELRRAGFVARIYVAERPTDAGGFRTIGVRGCAESHLACLREAVEDGVDVCVIAEDDVLITRRIGPLLRVIERELRELDWEFVYLGHLPESPARGQGMARVSEHIVRSNGWEILGAHLVAINASALPTVVRDFERRFEPGGWRIDTDGIYNEIRRDHGLATFFCVPNLAIQGSSPSGITESSSLRSRLLRRHRVRAVREALKRSMFEVQVAIPTALTFRRWSRQAARRERRHR